MLDWDGLTVADRQAIARQWLQVADPPATPPTELEHRQQIEDATYAIGRLMWALSQAETRLAEAGKEATP